jgi:integrase
MRDEAYVLREWWEYLLRRGIRWDEAVDQTMKDWRAIASDAEKIAETRIARRLEVVFTFYSKIHKALQNKAPLVGETLGITGVSKNGLLVWTCAGRRGRGAKRRQTPRTDAVRLILEKLRKKGATEPVRERNWLIGRCGSEAGLRREEIANLEISGIALALEQENIHGPSWTAASGISKREFMAKWLIGAGKDAALQREILDKLEILRVKELQYLFVDVKGKGRKIREAPFPISFIRDLLVVNIWGMRPIIMEKRSTRRSCSPDKEFLFLSEKTGDRLTPGAIGDLLKWAFRAVGIKGSGHRLRAHFATMYAAALWAELFANNGFRWDQTIYNTVLDRVAEALGHAKVTTSVKHYVDLAVMTYFGTPTKSKLREFRRVWAQITKNHMDYTRDDFNLIIETLHVLSIKTARLFKETLRALLNDPELNPRAAAPNNLTTAADPSAPKLTLVHSADGPPQS